MISPTKRLLLLIGGVLLIPIIPFVVMGAWFEPWLETLLSDAGLNVSPAVAFVSIVGILAVDILLPVPSSAVCTFAGTQLGTIYGTFACWFGLNVSAGIGYWIGSKFGRPIAMRFTDESTISRLEKFDKRSSIVCLAVCRALPIVAEASVLLMGMKKLSLASFWPVVTLTNLLIATTFCALGHYSAKANAFFFAICVSIAIPILFVLIWKAKQ